MHLFKTFGMQKFSPKKDYFIFFLKKKEAKKGAHLKFNGMAKSPPELREILEILKTEN